MKQVFSKITISKFRLFSNCITILSSIYNSVLLPKYLVWFHRYLIFFKYSKKITPLQIYNFENWHGKNYLNSVCKFYFIIYCHFSGLKIPKNIEKLFSWTINGRYLFLNHSKNSCIRILQHFIRSNLSQYKRRQVVYLIRKIQKMLDAMNSDEWKMPWIRNH